MGAQFRRRREAPAPSATSCEQLSFTPCVRVQLLDYIDVIEPQETVWIQDMSVIGIAIHNFVDTSERTVPVKLYAEQAVLRRVLESRHSTGTARSRMIGN